jgi:hypothetical protein
MMPKVLAATEIGPETLTRILREGFGPGAWHGPDFAAAIADVTPETAFRRPGKGRHNIAEVVLHHAWVIRNVVSQLTGDSPAKFPLQGEDWFTIDSAKDLQWPDIVEVLETQQRSLEAAFKTGTYAEDANGFELALGVTCHAVYHAGQIQLVKRLIEHQS